jgi:hypothetical protein
LTPLPAEVMTPEVKELPVETTHEQADDNAAKRTH